MKNFWKIFFASLLGCIVACVVLTILCFGLLGSIASVSSKTEVAVPSSTILKIDFKNAITEQAKETFNFNITSQNFSGGQSISLLQFVSALDVAANDPAVKFIYMSPETLNMGVAQTEEVRAALERFRRSGKAIVSYSTKFSNQNYYVASVADKVILNGAGDVMIFGLSSQIIFLKDLMDKVGVEVQLIRHGKYKAAAEQFIQNDISDANREQNQVMLSTIWNAWCDDIAASRDFTAEQFNEWIDNLSIGDAQTAYDKGLVDEIWFQDQVEEYLCGLFGVDKAKDLNFTSIADYAKAKVKVNHRAKDKIAVLYADGEIAQGESDEGIASDKYVRMIQEIRRDSTIKAVLLRVNSPGGDAQAAEMIRRELSLLNQEKPVVVSYGEYAASGGYWISAGGDKIFSDRTTLTGSIGVFSLIPNFGKVVKKIGVNPVSISTNKHGDFGNGFRAFDSSETDYMQGYVESVYSDFLSIVANGRNLETEYVDEIGQGRVWAGNDALRIGLVDEIGTLADALSYTETVAGLDSYQLVEYPVQKTAMQKLMDVLSSTQAAVETVAEPFAALQESYIEMVESATSIRTMARVPYLYNIK